MGYARSKGNMPGQVKEHFTLNPDAKEFIPQETSGITGSLSREESEWSYYFYQSNGEIQPTLFEEGGNCGFYSNQTKRNEQAVAKTESCADLITLSKPFNASENHAFEVRDPVNVDTMGFKWYSCSRIKCAHATDTIFQSALPNEMEKSSDQFLCSMSRYLEPENSQTDPTWSSEKTLLSQDEYTIDAKTQHDQCTQNVIELMPYLLQDNEPAHEIQQELRDLLNCAALTDEKFSTPRVVPTATDDKDTSLEMMCTRSDEELLYISAWNVASLFNSTSYPHDAPSMGPVSAENLDFLFNSTHSLHDAPAVSPASWASLFKSTPYQHGTPSLCPMRAPSDCKESSGEQLTNPPKCDLTVGSYSKLCTDLGNTIVDHGQRTQEPVQIQEADMADPNNCCHGNNASSAEGCPAPPPNVDDCPTLFYCLRPKAPTSDAGHNGQPEMFEVIGARFDAFVYRSHHLDPVVMSQLQARLINDIVPPTLSGLHFSSPIPMVFVSTSPAS